LINTLKNEIFPQDNGGRRSEKDRREFAYYDYTPERRSFKDRRSGFDRRTKLCTDKITIDRRNYIDNISLSPC
jgi:hypothetical protein